LLLAIQLPAFASGSLVPWAQDLDRGDHPLIPGQGTNFDENSSIRPGDENSLAKGGDLSRRQGPIQRRADLTDQQVMHARPNQRVFQVRVHARKRTGHIGSPVSATTDDINGVCFYDRLWRVDSRVVRLG
jgi:hypothetical protein